MFLLKKIKKSYSSVVVNLNGFPLKNKYFEIVMEYFKLMSGYIKSFADSSKKGYCYSYVFNLKEHTKIGK